MPARWRRSCRLASEPVVSKLCGKLVAGIAGCRAASSPRRRSLARKRAAKFRAARESPQPRLGRSERQRFGFPLELLPTVGGRVQREEKRPGGIVPAAEFSPSSIWPDTEICPIPPAASVLNCGVERVHPPPPTGRDVSARASCLPSHELRALSPHSSKWKCRPASWPLASSRAPRQHPPNSSRPADIAR